jgi:hypothetical protein
MRAIGDVDRLMKAKKPKRISVFDKLKSAVAHLQEKLPVQFEDDEDVNLIREKIVKSIAEFVTKVCVCARGQPDLMASPCGKVCCAMCFLQSYFPLHWNQRWLTRLLFWNVQLIVSMVVAHPAILRHALCLIDREYPTLSAWIAATLQAALEKDNECFVASFVATIEMPSFKFMGADTFTPTSPVAVAVKQLDASLRRKVQLQLRDSEDRVVRSYEAKAIGDMFTLQWDTPSPGIYSLYADGVLVQRNIAVARPLGASAVGVADAAGGGIGQGGGGGISQGGGGSDNGSGGGKGNGGGGGIGQGGSGNGNGGGGGVDDGGGGGVHHLTIEGPAMTYKTWVVGIQCKINVRGPNASDAVLFAEGATCVSEKGKQAKETKAWIVTPSSNTVTLLVDLGDETKRVRTISRTLGLRWAFLTRGERFVVRAV